MSAVLREMTEDDLPLVLSWRNREDVRQNMYTFHLISEAEHRDWWERECRNPASRLLIFELDGVSAGVVTFTRYTGHCGTASWAFYSGDPARRGIGALMEDAALSYAFETLGLRRLECEVLAFNHRVVTFHRRHGFQVEGVLREAYERDGDFHDIYRLAMLKGDWQQYSRSRNAVGSMQGKRLSKTITFDATSIDHFAKATGDFNPIHLDSAAARRAGFEDRIAHGLLSGGFLSAAFAGELPGPGAVYVSQTLRFLRPIIVGSECELQLKVISHIGRRLTVDCSISHQGETCVTGEAILITPRQEQPAS